MCLQNCLRAFHYLYLHGIGVTTKCHPLDLKYHSTLFYEDLLRCRTFTIHFQREAKLLIFLEQAEQLFLRLFCVR